MNIKDELKRIANVLESRGLFKFASDIDSVYNFLLKDFDSDGRLKIAQDEMKATHSGCGECINLGQGSPEDKVSEWNEDTGNTYCKKQDEVVKAHSKKDLIEWLENCGRNECRFFISSKDF